MIKLTKESQTLFIPLFCKANANKYCTILTDTKADEIVNSIDYDFNQTKYSKYLCIYMAIRAKILDDYAQNFIKKHPDCIVIHLGCGLDSRVNRLNVLPKLWVDLDLPDVISFRKQFYTQSKSYQMISSSVTDNSWFSLIPYSNEPVLIIAEGLTMYLTNEQNEQLFKEFSARFAYSEYIFDAYSVSAVKWSKYKNPVNKMGAVIRWGLDDPTIMQQIPNILHLNTQYFTGKQWSDQLLGLTKFMFNLLYGNSFANSLYRIYSFSIND